MAKLNQLIKKLQLAILNNGVKVKVNQNQFFIKEQNRMATCYTVTQRKWSDSKRRMADIVVLKTCSTVEVIKFLAKMLEELKNESES